ncbi:translocation and assembly module TamA [Novimethylophilus kurashikiensis]|uniref:Translocation and assembly module TamA n=1 Tax=Novimethylophilus kurashikiensis TaxID=1825523 RepID=A0A2R5FAD7_9PROT|nr:autotransporter assembly complex family protein [Novimethylophilus kurashikiensis]GBG13604.1 translocation and assembly module TamA [Novimethylophilus kurashikiensis]
MHPYLQLSPDLLKAMLLALLLGLSLPIQAAYEVAVDAPKPLRELLLKFLDVSRYKNRKDLSQDQFDFMLATTESQVAKLVATEGYFSPKTRVDVTTAQGKRRVSVHVDAGPRSRIAKVDVHVQGPAVRDSPAQVERLIRQWPLVEGAPFRQEDWDQAKRQSLQQLRNHLYAAAEMTDSAARIDADRHEAALSVDYDSGPPFTLGPLKISGTQRYPEWIVDHVNPLKAGEPYDAERLLALQRQIVRTPYYSNAVIDIDRDPANADHAPVTVSVTEYPSQRISGGVGYSTDTGASIEGHYSHNNVFGKAWVLDTQAKLEQERQTASLNLAMPPDSANFVNSADLTYLRTTLEGVDLRSVRYGLWRSRVTDKLDLAFKLQYFQDRLEQLNGAEIPSGIIVQPGEHQALMVSMEWTSRHVDDLVFPRRGYIVSNMLGVALKNALTDETFVRAQTRLRQFFPVGDRDLVILGGTLGAVIARRGDNVSIPASLLFRAGGTETIRGYDYLSIGNTVNGTVYPTRYLAVGSVEYQHWFLPKWGAAVFYDVGTATDNWPDKEIFQGIGVGARWRSPVGPINADLAYGVERGEIRPHFSLSVAF